MRERRRGHLNSLDRTEHRDRGGDDAVAEEQRRAEDPERYQEDSVVTLLRWSRDVSAMIPPSPRLCARMMKPAYLIDTTTISAQKINEAIP